MKEQILANKINVILSEWDPIGVEKPISDDEYRQYIPEIIRAMDHMENLKDCFIHIVDQLGISYDLSDDIFQEDITSVSEKIFALQKA
jgi:hypothetical protein